MNNLYPIFLKLEKMQVLIVGGGNVALEKIASLLKNAPKTSITIVAPKINATLKLFISNYPLCKIIVRDFEAIDIEKKQLVICATNNKTLHKKIKKIANAKGLLVNVADTPNLCDFYLGSIVQKKNLKIAISTNGKSPTIAKRIKEVLNQTIPNDIDTLLKNMQKIRNKLDGNFAEKVKQLNELTKNLVNK